MRSYFGWLFGWGNLVALCALVAAPFMAEERSKTLGYMEALHQTSWPGGVPPGAEPAMLTFRWALLIAVLAGVGRVLCGPAKAKSSPTEDFRRLWRETTEAPPPLPESRAKPTMATPPPPRRAEPLR